jgi:simple sugar transport system permease protein
VRLERRERVPVGLALAAPIAACAAALVLAAVLIRLAGAPVLVAFGDLVVGAFGSKLAITETLVRATPLVFTGLSVAVAFRARLWNIGAEGQLYAGALAVAALGSGAIDLPAPLLVPVLLAAGAAAGALLLLGPVVLRLRFGVDEVVTTLLLNFVMLLFVSMMIEGPLRDPLAFGWPQSAPIVDAAALPRLVAGSRLHAGLLLALLAAIATTAIQSRTVFGLQARAIGFNAAAARFAGVRVPTVLLGVACLSGGLAGLAGAVEVLGLKGYLTGDLSPGFGYTGIVVAMLAGLHPLGVVGAALFVAAIFVGADAMSRAVAIPTYIADVTVAISLLTMLLALLLVGYRIRR